jgi:phosphohistidine swiveling domain-containing protein
MERALQSAGLVLSSVQFLDYVVTSATYRDRAKFMFSSLLSDILEAIACAGSLMGLGRAEMALLRIEQIVGSRGNDAVVRRPGYWQELVEQSRRLEAGHEGLVFPAVLMHEDDLLYVPAGATSPNFVTSGVVQAPVVQLDGRLHSVGTDIDGCIAMVEAADPGYDWMFSRGISGLITRYGGMASHMAIRCHEMRIPAVIGCGDTMYEKLQRARVVRIDAGSRTVQIVESR